MFCGGCAWPVCMVSVIPCVADAFLHLQEQRRRKEELRRQQEEEATREYRRKLRFSVSAPNTPPPQGL
jgi:hypothetical protein